MRVAVCEDDSADMKSILKAIGESGYPAETASFESGARLLETFARGRYDIVFLDIYMPDGNGIETARAIRAIDSRVVLAFVTSSQDHTREGYRFGALKYIEKPFDPLEVKAALELAAALRQNRDACAITTKEGTQEIPVDEILYVEASNHRCVLHLINELVQTSIGIDGVALLLPQPCFVRCHRSFIVNLGHVKAVDRDFVMTNGDRVYIRGKDVQKMEDVFARYLADEARRVGGER